MATTYANVDDYIAALPDGSRRIMTEIRGIVRTIDPDSADRISYQIPTVTQGGRSVVYYAAWKRHIGMYPIPSFDDDLDAELAPYRTTKDTIRFPLDKPMPYGLIERLLTALLTPA
jgi:uncharacterized protein YdhG (YjbR/CyaY superfamily)